MVITNAVLELDSVIGGDLLNKIAIVLGDRGGKLLRFCTIVVWRLAGCNV